MKPPQAPFFLGLLTKIGNPIYELPFKREGFTLLQNANVFFPRGPDLKDNEDNGVGMCGCYRCGYDRVSH